MGGLALGNLLVVGFPRWSHHSLQAYAVLEASVAVSGIAVTYTLPRLAWLLVPVAQAADGHPGLVNLTRFVTAFGILLVPASAMGATLPLLVGALSHQRARLGAAFGCLYGWNTLGAVAGVLAAELVLIERIGVAGSAWLATLLDLAAAAVAVAIVRLERPVTPDLLPGVRNAGSLYEGPTSLFVCAFLSGVTLLEKDTRLALECAAAAGFDGPLGAAASSVFAQAHAAGLASEDDAAVFKLLSGK